ncbi:MAG: hypothetical protein E6Q97_10430 [Desulfurellales bacterium]|nr:MAG: hypothetical protein E6Q97_10430 [Desulfurellales bacterium]
MAGVDNNMAWPSWEELFGPDNPNPNPDPGTDPRFPPTPDQMPGYLKDRLYGDGGGNDQLGWNVGGQPDRGPAPDPMLAPAGMVANPYYYLPGNAAYIPEARYNELMLNQDPKNFTRSGGIRPQYDAYDARLQSPGAYGYKTPEQLGYDPGAPWQREEDYYAALKARTGVSMAGGSSGIEERGYVFVDGKIIPWGEYVSSGISADEFKQGPDFFSYTPIPKGFDNSQARPPSYGIDPMTGEAVNTEFFVENVPPEYRGAYTPLQWAVGDISRSQPRANPLGEEAFMGAPGGVVTPGTDAFDYLRGMSPSEITLSDGTVTTDPNPFRGKPGTTTQFMAETGDTPDMYPGVSFYEVSPDGGFKKVSKFEPGKEYFGVRESYDYTGFPMNPTISNAPAGTNFTVRIGDGGSINIADLDPSISLTSVTAINPATGQRKTFAPQDIQDGVFGTPGEIPAGATLVVSKASGPITDSPIDVAVSAYNSQGPETVASMMKTGLGKRFTDAGYTVGADGLLVKNTVVPKYDDTAQTYIDPASGKYWFNDGTPAGKWLDKEDYDDAKSKQIYYDGKVWVDPVSGKYWVNDGTPEGKWVDRPAGEVIPPTPTPKPTSPTTSGTTTSAADFNTQMVSYIGGFYGKAGPSGLTYGKSGSIYPEYDDPTLESFAGDGWVIPIAETTVGGSVVEIKKAAGGGKVWVFNPTDKVFNIWDEVKSGSIEAGKRYVIVLSNTAIKNANTAASKVKK